ncbi:hypothetical protein ACFL2J_00755 [Candidatus Omnitrophota bacterium]
MRSIKFLLILSLLIGFCGCVVAFKNINEENFADISMGMSKEEVVVIVGEPVDKKTKLIEGKEYEEWSYPIEEKFAKKYNPLGYLYYEVLFKGDKVKEWYKARVYSQPKYDLEYLEAPDGTKAYRIFEK